MAIALPTPAETAAEFVPVAHDAIDAHVGLLPDTELEDLLNPIARVLAPGIEQTATALVDAIVGR